MTDLLLPVYLFVVYLAIACWLRAPLKSKQTEPKSKAKTIQIIKGILLPPQVRDPIVLDVREPVTLEQKTQRRKKQTLSDVIRAA
jgi:hypothetical protein